MSVGARGSLVAGEIGDLVLQETILSRGGKQFVVHRAGQSLVHIELAGLQLRVERRVLLVNDFVARQMFAAEGERFTQGRAPHVHGLRGNGKHEVDVHVVEARLAQRVETLEDLLAGMNPPQTLEQRGLERLHAHGDATDAGIAPEPGLFQRDRGWIGFNGPFRGAEQVKTFHGAQDGFPLAQIQNRRRAAAEENRGRLEVGRDHLQFTHQRGHVAIDELAAGGFRVKSTILAFVRAERHMDIKTGDGRSRH